MWSSTSEWMTNPFNPEAGDAPAPLDERDRALAERSAKVIWRAFPYFAWRYGGRGRSFGRSDSGYLVTLASLDEGTARRQVKWLIGVLVPRGMPSLLMEYQLESLGKLWRREHRPQPNVFLMLASELRSTRMGVLDVGTFEECERLCLDGARGDAKRRGAGRLIAAAAADHALGLGEHDAALARWFSDAERGDAAWAAACAATLSLAQERCRLTGGAPS